jgi:hypothetical protein
MLELPMFYFKQGLPFLLVFLIVGCFPSHSQPRILRGIVFSSGANFGGIISPVIESGEDEGELPLPDANVFISRSNDWTRPLPGFETKTAKNGTYTLSLVNLPPLSGDSRYLLVATKDGYVPFTLKLSSGTAYHYIENTIWLEAAKKPKWKK